MRKIFCLLLVCGCGLFLSCRRNVAEVNEIQGFTMGTYYRVLYCGTEDGALPHEVDSLLKYWNAVVSVFDTTSCISRLNRGENVTLDENFITLFKESQRISLLTSGAFDPTVAPLIDLYGFARNAARDVSPALRDSVLQFVGYEKVTLQNGCLNKTDNRILLDFNAIAKGYAVDMLADWLQKKGLSNCLVDIGGEVVTCGSKQGTPWRVGIQVPTQNRSGDIASTYDFDLTDAAVATSGNYRNYHEHEGKRVNHIVNPHTGCTENSDLLSVTVLAPRCVTADALATAFMVMGLEKSLRLLKQHPEWAAYFICGEQGGLKHYKTRNFPAGERVD